MADAAMICYGSAFYGRGAGHSHKVSQNPSYLTVDSVTEEQLSCTKSLKGAILPDGTKHE